MERVVLTGAGGRVASATALLLAERYSRSKRRWSLCLSDTGEGLKKAQGLRDELMDCCFEGLQQIDAMEVGPGMFEGAHGAILIGAKARQPTQCRADLLAANASSYAQQGEWLGGEAASSCRVLVVGNPCNTLCWASWERSGRSPDQFTAMTELDGLRARGALARQAQASPREVTQCAVWGNHSESCVPDRWHAQIRHQPAAITVGENWLQDQWTPWVQRRGSEILARQGQSTAISAARAIVDTWWAAEDLPQGQWLSAGCWTTNISPELPEGLFVGAPCVWSERRLQPLWKEINQELLDALQPSLQELLDERDAVRHLLGGAV